MSIKTRTFFTRFRPYSTLMAYLIWLTGSQAGAQAPAWQVDIGGPQEIWHAQAMDRLPSGDVVVAGDARTYRALYFMRLNPQGDTIWSKYLPATAADERIFLQDFQTDALGNVHILYFDAGASTTFYARLNAWGTEQTTYTLWPYAHRFALTDDGILFAGVNGPEQDAASCLLKTDLNGDIVWGKNLDLHANIARFIPDDSGGFRMSGYDGEQGVLLRLSESGDILWQRLLDTPVFSTDMALAPDGSMVLASSADTGAIYLQRIAADGSLVAEAYDFYTPAYMPVVHRVRLSDDGHIYLTGQLWLETDNHVLFLARYDVEFNRINYREADSDESLWVGRDLAIGDDGRVLVCGYRQYLNPAPGIRSYFTVAGIDLTTLPAVGQVSDSAVQVWPNPATEYIWIGDLGGEAYRFTLYESCGTAVMTLDIYGEQRTVDISGLPEGVYWYTLSSGGMATPVCGKMVIHRP